MGNMVSLDSIINDYLSESEQSNHKYFRLWHIAFRLMDTLGIDFFYTIKSVKLPLNSNYTVTLPSDYGKWTKVGYLNNVGEVAPLKYNESLSTFGDLLPDRQAKITGNSVILNFYSPSSPTFYNYYNVNFGYGNLYGLPTTGSYGGQFKVDEANGVIILDTYWAWSDLMLEYRANPREGDEYYVPMEFREAIIAGLAWKDIANIPSGRKGNLGDKRDRRHEFYNERRLANARYKPFNLDQAYLASVEASRLTVKVG